MSRFVQFANSFDNEAAAIPVPEDNGYPVAKNNSNTRCLSTTSALEAMMWSRRASNDSSTSFFICRASIALDTSIAPSVTSFDRWNVNTAIASNDGTLLAVALVQLI